MTRASDVSTPKEQEMSQVRFEREGPVGSIVLNHPPQNRIGHQMMLDLTDAVAEASVSDIRVLLVRGDGNSQRGASGAAARSAAGACCPALEIRPRGSRAPASCGAAPPTRR